MKRKLWAVAAVAITMTGAAFGASARKDSAQAVDSGSFGIYVNGKRVATETFTIQQGAEYSVWKSQVKAGDGTGAAMQTAEMEVTPAGELRRYEWHEMSPEKSSTTVEVSNEFLIEHLTPAPPDKPMEQPFLLPHTTMILDDYFFSQREILAWRYLAAGCIPGAKECNLTKAQFGILIPRQRVSSMVSLEYAGKEKVNIHGVERQLDRFNMATEGPDWALWMDESLKIVRITVAAEATEAVRD